MKPIFVVVLIVQALALQGTSAQCLRSCNNVVAAAPTVGSCGCGCGCSPTVVRPTVATIPATVVQVPSVANTLADTLSLLTVSSLLAETLPLAPCSCGGWNGPWGGCGCGGLGYGYGYGLGPYNVLL